MKRSICSGVPACRMVGAAHQPIVMSGPNNAGPRELLVDHQLLPGDAARPNGSGQCGAMSPRLGQRPLVLFVWQRGDFGDRSGDLRPDRLAVTDVHLQLAADAVAGQRGDRGAATCRGRPGICEIEYARRR